MGRHSPQAVVGPPFSLIRAPLEPLLETLWCSLSVTARVIPFEPSLTSLTPFPQGSPGKDGVPGVRGDKGDVGFMGPRGLKVGRGLAFFPHNQDLMLEGEVSRVRGQVSGVRCCGILPPDRCREKPAPRAAQGWQDAEESW